MPAPLLVAENLTLGYDRSPHILERVSFEIRPGDFIGISGPNGGGKTTLVRALLGLIPLRSGRISYPLGRRPVMGYMPQQNGIDRKFPISVEEVADSGLEGRHFASRRERKAEVGKALEAVGLSDLAHSPIGTLSGGQLQRALLARAIVSRPELLVLDEPDSYVDAVFRERLYALLPHFPETGAILLVTHDEEALKAFSGRRFVIDRSFREL